MRRVIVALLAALALAFTVTSVPAHADEGDDVPGGPVIHPRVAVPDDMLDEAARVQAMYPKANCWYSTKKSSAYWEFNIFTHHFEDEWAAELRYHHCVNSNGEWDVLHGYQRRLLKSANQNCAWGDIDGYRMNISPMGPTDPPIKYWDCEDDTGVYRSYHDLNDKVLEPYHKDRCFRMNYAYDIRAHADYTGRGPQRCL